MTYLFFDINKKQFRVSYRYESYLSEAYICSAMCKSYVLSFLESLENDDVTTMTEKEVQWCFNKFKTIPKQDARADNKPKMA